MLLLHIIKNSNKIEISPLTLDFVARSDENYLTNEQRTHNCLPFRATYGVLMLAANELCNLK